MAEKPDLQRAAVVKRLRELVTEARYIARDQGFIVLERYLVSALICVNDLEREAIKH